MPGTKRRRKRKRRKRRKTRSNRRSRRRRGGRVAELAPAPLPTDAAIAELWARVQHLIQIVNRCFPNECRNLPTAEAVEEGGGGGGGGGGGDGGDGDGGGDVSAAANQVADRAIAAQEQRWNRARARLGGSAQAERLIMSAMQQWRNENAHLAAAGAQHPPFSSQNVLTLEGQAANLERRGLVERQSHFLTRARRRREWEAPLLESAWSRLREN